MSRDEVRQIQGAGVSPATATPSGYKLYGRNRSGYNNGKYYIYSSDRGYYTDEDCRGTTCTLRAQLYASFKENVVGGSSKRWLFTLFDGVVKNPSGESWSFDATYYCGVNVSGGGDHICGNGADGSNSTAPMYNNEQKYKSFERVNGNTVFPMIDMVGKFTDGYKASGKFRGWDTCNRSTTTALCADTGTGN